MLLKNIPFAIGLTLVAALIVGCGPENNSGYLTKEDIAYIKRKRLEEMYGGTSTVTQTQTISVATTVTLSTTVNATQ